MKTTFVRTSKANIRGNSMSNDKLEAAYDTFAKRIGRMLERKGAERHGISYHLPTPGGVLIVKPWHNWLFCRFENPIAGFIVSHGLSHCDSGVWNSNYSRDAELLVSDTTFNQVECEIDSFLTRSLCHDEMAVAFASGENARRLRNTFLINFGRLQSVCMAAREAVASVAPSLEEFQSAYGGKCTAAEAADGSSSR
jgi:hypothetical protein